MTTGYHAAFEPAMRQALAEAAAAMTAAGTGEQPHRPSPAAPGDTGAPAEQQAEVPVGAVIMDASGAIVARAHNRCETDTDPTAHAEIAAIRAAAKTAGTWRLDGFTLVVTLEPCTMCAGALSEARVSRLVYGAADPRSGAVGSRWDVLRDRRFPRRTEVVAGILAAECGQLLRDFFAGRRDRPA